MTCNTSGSNLSYSSYLVCKGHLQNSLTAHLGEKKKRYLKNHKAEIMFLTLAESDNVGRFFCGLNVLFGYCRKRGFLTVPAMITCSDTILMALGDIHVCSGVRLVDTK